MTEEIKIDRLEFPDNVRKRPGMYLGGLDDFTTPEREIINNGSDELLNGYGTYLHIFSNPQWKCIIDNGRGLPVYKDPKDPSKTIAEATVTEMHTGSKFTAKRQSGMNGVGSAATNAVSSNYLLMVNLKTDQKINSLPDQFKMVAENTTKPVYYIHFKKGVKVSEGVVSFDDIHSIIDFADNSLVVPEDFSTLVCLSPDLSIYESGVSKIDYLPLKVLQSTIPNTSVFVNGEKVPPFDFIHEVAGADTKLLMDKTIPFKFKYNDKLEIEGILAYSLDDVSCYQTSLINLINTRLGGYMNSVTYAAIGDALSSMNSIVKRGDSTLGLRIYIVTFTEYEMVFDSQTKEHLKGIGNKNSEEESVNRADLVYEFRKYFEDLFKTDAVYFSALIDRIIEYKRQMDKMSNIDYISSKVIMGDESDRQRAMSGEMTKIYEATSNEWSKRELFIPEGISASGRLIRCRNKKYQSVLPIRGKLSNTSDFFDGDLVDNPEILAIINTIGCGIGALTDVSKSRYGKIIIATDADSDGNHIANLITALFLYHAPAIIKAGMLYKLETPYYVVENKDGNEYYFYNEKDKVDFNKVVHKRKGLGSYSVEEAERFMTNPDTYRLLRITYPLDREDDVHEASKLMWSSLARRELMINAGVL